MSIFIYLLLPATCYLPVPGQVFCHPIAFFMMRPNVYETQTWAWCHGERRRASLSERGCLPACEMFLFPDQASAYAGAYLHLP